jgi:CheY-like chemotaxis protein
MDKKVPIILALDDTPFVLTQLEEILGKKYDLRTTKTPSQAFGVLTHYEVDVLLLDVEMPIISGPEFLQYIKEHYTRIPKIIFITSHNDKDTVENAVKMGAKGFIVKPIQPDSLIAKIQEVLAAG